jgi:hypothetical protein
MKYDEYFVGQKVFISELYTRGLREVSVKKIGRQYVYFDYGYRVEKGSPNLVHGTKGMSSPGRIYLSREEHAHEVMNERAWTEFCRDVQYARRPKHVTLELIEKARELLQIPRKA